MNSKQILCLISFSSFRLDRSVRQSIGQPDLVDPSRPKCTGTHSASANLDGVVSKILVVDQRHFPEVLQPPEVLEPVLHDAATDQSEVS